MDKVRIGEHDETAAEIKCKAEEKRADAAVRELGAVKRRIREFYGAVDYISFANTDTAPSWAPKWFDYLLDGVVPQPVGERRAEVAQGDVQIVDGLDGRASSNAGVQAGEAPVDNTLPQDGF